MESLKQIKLDDIVPSRDNARKFDKKTLESEDFKDFVKSVKAGGVRVPIHVRPHPKRKGKFEIRAGERRWRASKAAGKETIPAIVHTDMTDIGAFDLTYIENKFRQDLKPMEEIEIIHTAIEKINDIKEVAKKIGKSEHWVRLRVNVKKNLIKQFAAAIEKVEVLTDWSIEHLVQIARLPANVQKQIVGEIQIRPGYWRDCSKRDLRDRIEKQMKYLRSAAWKLDDEKLYPKAGACTKCPKRTSYEPLLWQESINKQSGQQDQCLDPFCWKEKLARHVKNRAVILSKEHAGLCYISSVSTSYQEDRELTQKYGVVQEPHKYKNAKKNSPGSVPALVVHGKGAGELRYIKKCTQTSMGSSTRAAGKPTPLKERKSKLRAKRWSQILVELREKVEKTIVKDVTYQDRMTAVMALVAVYGNVGEHMRIDTVGKEQSTVKKFINNKDRNGALEFLWKSFKPTLDHIICYNGPVTQMPESDIKEAKWIAALIGVDIDAMFEEVSKQKGFTEPKGWKNLNADGSPRKKKK